MIDGAVGRRERRRHLRRVDDELAAILVAGTKVLSSHARSVMTLVAGLPLILALVKSGYCVFEWLPQMVMQVTASLPTPAFIASAETARLWSSRVIACQRLGGHVLAVAIGDEAVRVARVADDENAHVRTRRSSRWPAPGRRRSGRSCG